MTWALSNRRSRSHAHRSPTRTCIRTLAEKASALGFSLIRNHPFVDGNKRIGHAAVEVFLVLNGYELSATVDEAESIILGVAAATTSREAFTDWLRSRIEKRPAP